MLPIEPDDPYAPGIFYWRGSERFVFPEFVSFLYKNDLLVNPIEGGLVLGPSHDDNGIQMIRKQGDEYLWIAEMEGYEYLVNPFATDRHHGRLEKINSSVYPSIFLFEEYPVQAGITTIDCRPVLVDGLSHTKWIGLTKYSQWIVNKAATQGNLLELNRLNLGRHELHKKAKSNFFIKLCNNLFSRYSK
jgi:hypothetical protein